MEIIGSEITETVTTKAYADFVFKLRDGTGLHCEWEDEVSRDDIIRFLGYNISLTKMHKIPFKTLVVTNKPPKATEYCNGSVTFKPRVITLCERDADAVIAKFNEKLAKGESINELELIYLPMYGSKSGKTMYELLDAAIKLTAVVTQEQEKRNKLQSLLILQMGKFKDDAEFRKVLEANEMLLDNNGAIKFFESKGEAKGIAKGEAKGIVKGASKLVELIKSGLTPEEALQEILAESEERLLHA